MDRTLIPLLTHDDEKALARAIEAGVLADAALRGRVPAGVDAAELGALAARGDRAWRRLAESNVRLVWLVVLPIARRSGVDGDDLFQEGYLGLLEAMRRYDHTRDARFATFALPWIRMRVSDAAANNLGSLGLPSRRARMWRRVLAVEARLHGALGRSPEDHEVAAASGEPVGVVRRLRAFTPVEYLADDQQVAQAEEPEPRIPHVDLHRLVHGLHVEQREVVVRRFGLGGHPSMTCQEVARVLGVSESTVRRRERDALGLLRGRAGLLAA